VKSRTFRIVIAFIVLAGSSGCTAYVNRAVTVHVRDAETKQPIEGAGVRAQYLYFLDFGQWPASWGRKEGLTDSEGKITLYFDPYKKLLALNSEAKGYQSEGLGRGHSVRGHLVPRHRFAWRREIIIDLYKDPEAQLELTVPDDYRGPVCIHFSPTEVPPEVPGQRRFTAEVERNGHVSVPYSGLLERAGGFGRVTARRRSGAKLVTETDRKSTWVAADEVAFRFITPSWEQHVWIYVIGTKAEADLVLASLWGDGNHFNEAAFKHLAGKN
jgi:hypothetical protein